ncbi:MAG: hypothetical protein AAF466_00250 [Bacteroidota bacterium]
MRKFILSLGISLLSFAAVAQSSYFNVTETEPFRDSRRGSSLEGVYTLEDGSLIAVRSAKKELMVSSFDANYKLQNDLELDLDRRESYLGTSFSDIDARIFTVQKVDKETRDVYCHTYDLATKKLSKSKVYTAVAKRSRGSKNRSIGPRKHNENFRGSPDGRFLAFAVDNVNAKTNSYAIRVYDEDMNLVYETSYYKEIDRYFQFDDFVVTNDAEVITVGKLYKSGKRDRKQGKANYDYVIHKVTEAGHSSTTLALEDNFIDELRFSQTHDMIRLFGFYSERSSSRMKGALTYNFNGTEVENIALKQAPFPESVYDDIYREARAERLKEKQKEFSNYYLDYALVDDYGNSYLLAEQFYITEVTVGGGMNGGMSTTTQFHYDNILVIKFDAEGNILWGRAILKKDSQPSYNALVLDNELHVFLNTGKNVKEKEDGRKKVKRGLFTATALFDVVFDENGEKTFELIQENKGKTIYRPYLGTFDYDKFVLANMSKSKKQFLVLSKK